MENCLQCVCLPILFIQLSDYTIRILSLLPSLATSEFSARKFLPSSKLYQQNTVVYSNKYLHYVNFFFLTRHQQVSLQIVTLF
jgi:hypothetical protein